MTARGAMLFPSSRGHPYRIIVDVNDDVPTYGTDLEQGCGLQHLDCGRGTDMSRGKLEE